MTLRWCIGLAVCLALVGHVAADPPVGSPRALWQRWCAPVCPSVGCCPDDYCRKPIPCVPPVQCGGPDDYCRKPIPCVPPVPCGGPDDYCRKSLPCLLCPPASPYLQCGPANGPGCVPGRGR